MEAAEALGLSETQFVQLALSQFVARKLPQYERDEGPLSPAVITEIQRRSGTQTGPVVSALFED